MPAVPIPLPANLPDLGRITLGLGLRVAAVLVLFLAISAVVTLLRRRGAISRPLGGLVKWLTGLGLLWGLYRWLQPTANSDADRVFTVATLALLWLIACNGVDFFYAKLLPGRLAGRPGRHILQDLLKFCILVVLVGWGLRQLLDIQLGSLLTSSAILTAVIGLSMQDTIGSLFSGLLLQVEKPFTEGDWIKVGDIEGRVAEVTWRYTKVVTIDSNEVLLPNNAVAKERLVNYSQPTPALIQSVCVPAPLDAPPVKVKSAILAALSRAEGVVKRPPPVVRLREIQSDRLIYAAVYHISAFNGRLAVADAVLSAVWYQFLERDIEIPAPARRVFVERPGKSSMPPEGLDTLRHVALLADLSGGELEMLARASVVRQFSPGQTIMATGDAGTTMSFILSGLVAVVIRNKEVARLAAGQIFGEMALLTGEPRQADIRAVEQTRCLEVDREGFRMVLSRHPEIVDRVRRIFADRAAANRSTVAPGTPDEATTLFARFCKLFL